MITLVGLTPSLACGRRRYTITYNNVTYINVLSEVNVSVVTIVVTRSQLRRRQFLLPTAFNSVLRCCWCRSPNRCTDTALALLTKYIREKYPAGHLLIFKCGFAFPKRKQLCTRCTSNNTLYRCCCIEQYYNNQCPHIMSSGFIKRKSRSRITRPPSRATILIQSPHNYNIIRILHR